MLVAIGGFREAFGEGHAGALGSVREVLEVGAVTDVRGVDAKAPVARKLGDVLEVQARAVDVLDLIVGQIVEAQRAALPLREVTEFAGEVDAALGVVDRFGHEIGVRADVPVVGQLDLRAIARRPADAREKETALALRADREAYPG